MSAQMCCKRGNAPANLSSRSGAPSRSVMSAACTCALSSKPSVSTRMWRLDVALAAPDLLRAIIAVDASALGGLHRLAVDDAGARLSLTSGHCSQPLTQD